MGSVKFFFFWHTGELWRVRTWSNFISYNSIVRMSHERTFYQKVWFFHLHKGFSQKAWVQLHQGIFLFETVSKVFGRWEITASNIIRKDRRTVLFMVLFFFFSAGIAVCCFWTKFSYLNNFFQEKLMRNLCFIAILNHSMIKSVTLSMQGRLRRNFDTFIRPASSITLSEMV